MTTYTFANMDKWNADVWAKADRVVRRTMQRVINTSQTPKAKGGKMPVLDGFLRKSLQSSVNGGSGLTGEASHIAVIAGMKATDTAEFGWTMAYARRQNYGFIGTDKAGRTYAQEGNHFLEAGVDQFQRFLDEEAAKELAR